MIGFSWIDYAVIIIYLVGVTALGSFFANQQKNAEDFFLAGRNVWWLPMALSVIATDLSAISFLGVPGYIIAHDLVLELNPLVFVWVLPLALYLFVRFFYRMKIISAYEYLEKRFNLPLRSVCSLLFICLRTSWMATMLYATAVALTEVTGAPFWICILVISSFTIVYSALGGMKAVIWTDVVQFVVFLLAIVFILVKLFWAVPGGAVKIWETASQAGHTRLLNFEGGLAAITTPAVLIGGTFLLLISYGVDQVIIQRYMAGRSMTEIKRSMMLQSWLAPVVIWSLAVIGLALFSYYHFYPDRLPAGLDPDKWFPHFIAHELPAGISGLVIAGILASTMDSLSSGLNSVTAACVIDFYRRFRPGYSDVEARSLGAAAFTEAQDRRELLISRCLILILGVLATGLAFVVGKIGVIAVIGKTLSGFFGGVLLGVFLLGILWPRANGPGSLLGGILGFAATVVVGLATSINLFWYAPIGCLVTVICGAILSRFFPAPTAEKLDGLTLRME